MCEIEVSKYAREKRFSAATAERWLAKSPKDQRALLNLALRLRLGENHFRDVLDAVEDIACRQESGLSTVLEVGPVAAVLSRELGRNETLKAVKQALRRLRYPQLTETERRICELVKELKLPSGVTVGLPQNLEGEDVSLTVQAASAAELKTKAAALSEAAAKMEWEEIFDLLGGEW